MADRAEQIDEMREWFLERYEHPARRTPFESAEGGYIWIYGGPFDAEEVLREQFEGAVPDELIEELARELEGTSAEWTHSPAHDYFDNDELGLAIVSNTEFFDTFDHALGQVRQLLKVPITDRAVEATYYRLLYIQVITILETYLSDAFINTVMDDHALTRRLVETDPDLRKEKISLGEAYTAQAKAKDSAYRNLLKVIWHRIDKVVVLYQTVLGVSFSCDRKRLAHAISVRHDLVHRNGKAKDGTVHQIDAKQVADLVQCVQKLVDDIDRQLPTP